MGRLETGSCRQLPPGAPTLAHHAPARAAPRRLGEQHVKLLRVEARAGREQPRLARQLEGAEGVERGGGGVALPKGGESLKHGRQGGARVRHGGVAGGGLARGGGGGVGRGQPAGQDVGGVGGQVLRSGWGSAWVVGLEVKGTQLSRPGSLRSATANIPATTPPPSPHRRLHAQRGRHRALLLLVARQHSQPAAQAASAQLAQAAVQGARGVGGALGRGQARGAGRRVQARFLRGGESGAMVTVGGEAWVSVGR